MDCECALLEIEHDAPKPRIRKAVKWVGSGIGRAGKGLWRVMRARSVRRRQAGLHFASMQHAQQSKVKEDCSAALLPHWSTGNAAASPMPQWGLPPLQLPGWLLTPLHQVLLGQPTMLSSSNWSSAHLGVNASGATTHSAGDSSDSKQTKRRERRAARQQRRESRRQAKQERKAMRRQHRASSAPASIAEGLPDSGLHPTARSVLEGFSNTVLSHMINPANTFPMLLHSAEHLVQQHGLQPHWRQQQGQELGQADDAPFRQQGQLRDSSSMSAPSPQLLLTVGCRNWGNWWDGRGLLRVKIYDFAIYVDSKQAQAGLPTSPMLLSPPQQELQVAPEAHSDLPSLLKSSGSRVDMSLVLKAARDVPLHLLAAEYEKVLRRRLDRVGGSPGDVGALKELLASFSDAQRLPSAVTTRDAGSARQDATDSGAFTTAAASAPGGSVRKGAMIVFERSQGGDVTARVGPVVLGTVSSPKVAEALFDLYLGDQPVSKTAKEAAAQTLQRMVASGPVSHHVDDAAADAASAGLQDSRPVLGPAHYLPTARGHEIRCDGRAAVKQKANSSASRKHEQLVGGSRLPVPELDACVLHMG